MSYQKNQLREPRNGVQAPAGPLREAGPKGLMKRRKLPWFSFSLVVLLFGLCFNKRQCVAQSRIRLYTRSHVISDLGYIGTPRSRAQGPHPLFSASDSSLRKALKVILKVGPYSE